MSSEEQNTAVGRLALERAELRKHHALVESEAARIIRTIHEASSEFLLHGLSFERTKAIDVLDKAIVLGGLDKLRSLIAEREQLSKQLAEVEGRAMLAGI
jgi:hypothetical protein